MQIPIVLGRTNIIAPALLDFPGTPIWNRPELLPNAFSKTALHAEIRIQHQLRFTLFENYSNVAFEFWHFPPILGPIKTDMSGNTVWPQALDFHKLAKNGQFLAFSTQNVNVASLAMLNETFSVIFKHCVVEENFH